MLQCYAKWRYSLLHAVYTNASCCSWCGRLFVDAKLDVPPSWVFFWPCLCPFAPTEQIFHNLRQECSRIQRRRQLEGAFNQAEACSSSDATSPISSLNAPSSPQGQKHSSKWLCDAINSPRWSSVLNSNVMPGLWQTAHDALWLVCVYQLRPREIPWKSTNTPPLQNITGLLLTDPALGWLYCNRCT